GTPLPCRPGPTPPGSRNQGCGAIAQDPRASRRAWCAPGPYLARGGKNLPGPAWRPALNRSPVPRRDAPAADRTGAGAAGRPRGWAPPRPCGGSAGPAGATPSRGRPAPAPAPGPGTLRAKAPALAARPFRSAGRPHQSAPPPPTTRGTGYWFAVPVAEGAGRA